MEMLLSVHVCMANMCHMDEGLRLNHREWGKYQHRLFGTNAICLDLVRLDYCYYSRLPNKNYEKFEMHNPYGF